MSNVTDSEPLDMPATVGETPLDDNFDPVPSGTYRLAVTNWKPYPTPGKVTKSKTSGNVLIFAVVGGDCDKRRVSCFFPVTGTTDKSIRFNARKFLSFCVAVGVKVKGIKPPSQALLLGKEVNAVVKLDTVYNKNEISRFTSVSGGRGVQPKAPLAAPGGRRHV